MISADLVAKAPRPAVNHHADLACRQPESGCDRRVEDLIHDLDLQEMITRAQAADLAQPSFQGTLTDPARVGVRQYPLVLAPVEVPLPAMTLADRIPGPRGALRRAPAASS